jgi:tetratricopeptide (TPR) repeat protein
MRKKTSVTLMIFMLLCSLVPLGLIGAQVMESNEGGSFQSKGNGMMGAGILGEEGDGEEGATEGDASDAIAEAQSLLEAYLEEHPDASSETLTTIQTLIGEATTAFDEGDYETALNKANEAIELLGDLTEEVEENDALMEAAAEAIEEAESLLADLVAAQEEGGEDNSELIASAEALIAEATTAFDEGDYETALNKANEAITLMGGEPVNVESEDDTSVIMEKAEQALADAEAAVAALQEAYVEGAHPAVSTLMDLAISKLENARAAFENGDYGRAKGQATAAASIAENALRKLEKSSEEGEEGDGEEGGKPEDTGPPEHAGPPEDAGPPEHAGPPENPGNGKGKGN